MKRIMVYVYLLVIGVLFILFYLNLPYSQRSLSVLLLIPIFFLIFHFFCFSSRIKEGFLYLSHSNLFLLGYVIVFYQYFVDLWFGNVTVDNPVFMFSQTIIPAIILANIGLVAFLLGFSIKGGYKLRAGIGEVNDNEWAYPILLLFFVVVICVFFLNIDRSYIIGSYGREGLKSGLANRCELMIKLLIYALIIMKVRLLKKRYAQCSIKQYLQSYGLIFYICFFVYLAYVLVSGDRGPLIVSVLTFILGFILLSNWRMRFVTMLACVFIASAFVTFLGIYRKTDPTIDTMIRIRETLTQRAYRDKSISPETRELAGSINTLCASVWYVPKEYPYTYGVSNVSQLLCSIPFMYGGLAVVLPQGYENRIYSANFVTYLIQGPNNTYGNGTSCIADIYLDMGCVGVILLMFCWGMLIKRLEISTFVLRRLSLLGYSASFVVFSNTIYVPRSSIIMVIRDVFWVWIILIMVNFICNFFVRNRV